MANKEREIWTDIEADYVTSDKPLTVLAEEFKVSYKTLRHKAGDGDWTGKRSKFKEASIKNFELAKIQAATAKRKTFDDNITRIAEIAAAKSAVKLTRATIQDTNGHLIDVDVSDNEIKDALKIASDALSIMYRVWDIPSPVQRVDANVNREHSPADEIEDEVVLAVEDAMSNMQFAPLELPGTDGGGNGTGNGNGTGEQDKHDADGHSAN